MSSALAIERDLNFGNSGQLAVETGDWRQPVSRDVSLVGTGRLKPADEIQLVNDVLDVVPISLGPVFGGGNVIWGAAPVARLGRNGPIIYQDSGGATTAEIFSALSKTDEHGEPISGALGYLHAGIITLITSPLEIGNIPVNPIYLFGEAMAARIFSMKKTALEKRLGRAVGVTEVESESLSEVFPNGSKAVKLLLILSLLAGAGLGVPTSGVRKKTAESSGATGPDGQGPEFKIPGWVWTAAGGIGLGGLISACARALGLPEPAVKVATNTPDAGPTPTPTERPSATHTAILAATQTETQTGGAGGPELPGGAPDKIRSLLETGINLPATDCVTTPETGGNKEVWDDWIKTLVENGANQTAIDELKATITAKLESQGTSFSTRTLELCGGGDGGWSLVIRDKSSGLFWWSYDLENNRFADRPDRVFNDRDWQFRPMPRKGLKSGLEVEILMINGWPLAVAVGGGRPIQHFDPVLGEFINFYPDPDTATPAPSNTPRPSAIPATRAPEPTPTLTLEPSPTALSALPCDQRGGPENECLTHLCYVSDYVDSKGNTTPKGVNGWYVDWYARRVLASGAAVLGDCP